MVEAGSKPMSFFNQVAWDRMTNKTQIFHDTVLTKYEFDQPFSLNGIAESTKDDKYKELIFGGAPEGDKELQTANKFSLHLIQESYGDRQTLLKDDVRMEERFELYIF